LACVAPDRASRTGPQILALSDAKLTEKLRKYKDALVESSREKNKKLQEKIKK